MPSVEPEDRPAARATNKVVEKLDPATVPFDRELNAMRTCAIDFDTLSPEQRHRVLYWLRQRYEIFDINFR